MARFDSVDPRVRLAIAPTPKAEPPRPRGDLIRPVGWDGVRITRVARNGIVQVRSTRFHVTRLLAGQTVYLIETNEHLLVFNDRGTEIMQHRWPCHLPGAWVCQLRGVTSVSSVTCVPR